MRSIEARFKKFSRPEQSTYITFAKAVRGQGFCFERIARSFSELVDKEDYTPEERKAILHYLHSLSNPTEAYDLEA